MAIGDTRLPEGTDSIIGGTSSGIDLSSTGGLSSTAPGFDNSASASTPRVETIADARAAVGEKASELRSQVADKMQGFAAQGKDRAVEGLDNIQRLIEEAADTVDAKVGDQYGAYIRQAGTSVASLTDMIRDKNVDDLLDDARDLVRRSPALAIGVATAAGFLIARVAKAGLDVSTPAATPTVGGVTPIAPVLPTHASGDRPTV